MLVSYQEAPSLLLGSNHLLSMFLLKCFTKNSLVISLCVNWHHIETDAKCVAMYTIGQRLYKGICIIHRYIATNIDIIFQQNTCMRGNNNDWQLKMRESMLIYFSHNEMKPGKSYAESATKFS